MLIVDAVTAEQTAEVRQLFEEYWASFGFAPCFPVSYTHLPPPVFLDLSHI